MRNVRLLWGAVTLMTAGNLLFIYWFIGRALTRHLQYDLFPLLMMGFLAVCGWTLLSFLFRKAQGSSELGAAFTLGFSFCLFLNLAVQSGLSLARSVR
jgi:hypothetical protein